MASGSEDLRVRKTLAAIHDAFAAMLLEMPYEKITVKALCDRALINKTTFYRYYPTLDDLLEELQSQFVRPYVESTRGLRYPQDIEKIIRAFMIYSAEQGPLYDAILSSGAYLSIMQKVLDAMGEERVQESLMPEGWSREEWSLYLTHVNMSQIRLYKQWVEDGRVVPVERMVSMTISLICDGARLSSPQDMSS